MLVNRDRLFRKWVEHYPVVLRLKLRAGRFRFLYERQETHGKNYGSTIYIGAVTLQASGLVKLLKTVPDEKDKVQVFKKFWQDWPENRSLPYVSPLEDRWQLLGRASCWYIGNKNLNRSCNAESIADFPVDSQTGTYLGHFIC